MSALEKIGGRHGFSGSKRVDSAPVPAVRNESVDSSLIIRGSSLWDAFAGYGAAGLPPLSENTAWTVSAIAACVNLIAGAISTLPLHVYRRDRSGNRERLTDDPLWWVFNEEFMPRWSAATGWEFLMASRLLHGDAFARIVRDRIGTAVGIEPIHPHRVTVAPWPDGSRLAYAIAPDPTLLPAHRDAQKPIVVDQDDMIHITGSGFDGCRTPSPLRYMLRMSGSVANATQEYSARFFANGARPDYALQTDSALTPEQVENLRSQIAERHGGVANSHKPMLLQGGLKFESISLPLEDLQLIATRQFQIEEICRPYGVPPFMIGHQEKTTSWGSGVEAMGTAFVRYTLGSHLKKIHNEFNRKFFRTYTRVVEFDTFELERADMKSLMEAFRVAIGRAGEPGFLTVDEVRGFLNFAPKGGDAAKLTSGLAPQPKPDNGGSDASQPA